MHRCFSLPRALPGNVWCFVLHPCPQWVFTLRHLRPSEPFFPNLGPDEENQLHFLAASRQVGCKKGGAAACPLRLPDHCWTGEEDFAVILLPQPLLLYLTLSFKGRMMPRSLCKHDCDPSVEAGKASGGCFLPSRDSSKPWWVAAELWDVPGDWGLRCIWGSEEGLRVPSQSFSCFPIGGTALLSSCLSSGVPISQAFAF